MEENEGATLLWGEISKLMGKIEDELDRLNWDSAIDMICDAFTKAESEEDNTKLFFTWYQFFFRFYCRLKHMDEKQAFNTVVKSTQLKDHDNQKVYRVSNYDINMYLWCRQKNLTDSLTNDWFLVPLDCLTASEKKRFESKSA